MADNKKYYWLKLKKDFFKRHDIQIIENMPNGKDYVLFYLKLLVESVDHEGGLRFNETIPYNEQMLATITNTNIDTVSNAMKLFRELGMVEILDDKTIYMNEVSKMLGTETYWAQKKREEREKKKLPKLATPQIGQCPIDVQGKSNVSKQEIEIELDIEKEKEIEIELETEIKNNVVQGTPSFGEQLIDDRSTTKEYRKHIGARIKQGATPEQFKYVIDIKCAEWLYNEQMKQHLNPTTLFREGNFDKYLNQQIPQNKKTLRNLVSIGQIDLSDVL